MPALIIRPLSPALMDDFGAVLRGNFGAGCWCMYPRMGDAELRALPGAGSLSRRKRAAMEELAAGEPAPGLLAYAGGEPAGWIAIAPRRELGRVARSRATPPVDDAEVWVIPCITVRKGMRGQGIAVALIGAAVEYAAAHGAPAVEAYPRPGRSAPAMTMPTLAWRRYSGAPAFASYGSRCRTGRATGRRAWLCVWTSPADRRHTSRRHPASARTPGVSRFRSRARCWVCRRRGRRG